MLDADCKVAGSGDPEINAQRWFRSGITKECESLVHDLLKV